MIRVEKITGKKTIFYDVDILDEEALSKIFTAVSLLLRRGSQKKFFESIESRGSQFQTEISI